MPKPTDDTQTTPPAGDNATEELDPILQTLFDSTGDAEVAEKLKANATPPAEPAAGKEGEGGDDKDRKTDTPPGDGEDTQEPPKKITRRRRTEQPEKPAVTHDDTTDDDPPPTRNKRPEPTAEEVAEREFEESLLEEEKEQLELARRAETKLGEKYRGFGKKMSKFLKAHQDYIEKAKQADPDVVFDESNIEYQNFLNANTPRIPPKDLRELDRIEIAEQVRKESDEKLNQVQDEVFRQTEGPKIKRQADEYFNSLVKTALPEDIQKSIQDEGLENARKKYSTELRIATRYIEAATDDIEEFMRLTTINPATKRPFTAYDAKNPKHARLVEFVNTQCDAFLARGGKLLKNAEGKTFVTRVQFYKLPPEKRANVWTFSDKQIVDMARVAVKGAIKHAIDTEHQRLAGEGWTRPTASPTAPEKKEQGADRRSPPAPAPSKIPAKPNGETPDDQVDPMTKLLMGE